MLCKSVKNKDDPKQNIKKLQEELNGVPNVTMNDICQKIDKNVTPKQVEKAKELVTNILKNEKVHLLTRMVLASEEMLNHFAQLALEDQLVPELIIRGHAPPNLSKWCSTPRLLLPVSISGIEPSNLMPIASVFEIYTMIARYQPFYLKKRLKFWKTFHDSKIRDDYIELIITKTNETNTKLSKYAIENEKLEKLEAEGNVNSWQIKTLIKSQFYSWIHIMERLLNFYHATQCLIDAFDNLRDTKKSKEEVDLTIEKEIDQRMERNFAYLSASGDNILYRARSYYTINYTNGPFIENNKMKLSPNKDVQDLADITEKGIVLYDTVKKWKMRIQKVLIQIKQKGIEKKQDM